MTSEIQESSGIAEDPSGCSQTPAFGTDASNSYAIRWSNVLVSPKDPFFSPSREGPGHGRAVLAAVDQARKFSLNGKRAVSLLLDVTTVYDQHAQALLKAGQSLNPLIAGQVKDASAVQESLVFWSGETSKLSSVWRTSLVPQWQAFLDNYADSAHAMYEKYQRSRTKCVAIRQRAVRARAHYAKATQEAEEALSDWKMGRKEEALPKGLTQKLRELQRLEEKYKSLVEWENECVEQCENMEVMLLDSFQQLEENRLVFFSKSLREAIEAQKHAFEEVTVSTKEQRQEERGPLVSSPGSPGRQQAYLNMKRSSLNGSIVFDEGTGIMDAETIGLPEQSGQLRDKVRRRLAARSTQVKSFQVLASFVGYVYVALERFNSSLEKIFEREQMGLDFVLDEMHAQEGSQDMIELWGHLIQNLRIEAEQASRSSIKLRKLTALKLDTMATYGDKLLNAAANSEDLVWKKLCEAGHAHNEAEERLNQTAAEKLKARERVSSVDNSKADETQSPIRMSKHVSRSLANMFSVLPNGGEHAMKMLDRGTVANIAQHTLEDADEKEAKGRQTLETTLELRSQLAEKYNATANLWLKQFDSEDMDGWGDLSEVFRTLSSVIQNNRSSILDSIGDIKDWDPDMYFTSLNIWVERARKGIFVKSGCPDGLSYRLEPDLISAPTLSVWMPKEDPSLKESPGGEDSYADDDDLDDEKRVDETEKTIFGSSDLFTVAGSSSKEEGDGSGDEQANGLLGIPNSFSDSLRGTFNFRKKNRCRYMRYPDVSMNTEMFTTYFWPDKVDPRSIPAVIDSFPCCVKEGTDNFYIYHGRVFISDVRLVFVGWAGKRLSIKHDGEILKIEPCKCQFSEKEDALSVKFQKPDSNPVDVLFFGFFDRQQMLELLTETRDVAQKKGEETRKAAELANQAQKAPVTPKDSVLPKMEIVISRHLRNISIQRFYELVWAEGINTNEKPLYGPWLAEGCLDVEVGPWEFVEFIGPWDKEKYTQKRSVSFRVKRKTHLYIGPPIAKVNQTQYCRVENQDRCILGMTVEMEGIPYADCFAVEVRWVASRLDVKDISIEVGVFVNFKKSTILKRKIQAGTLEETTSTHESLFDYARKACIAAGGEDLPEEDEETQHRRPSKSKLMVPVIAYAICLMALFYVYRFYSMRDTTFNERALSSDEEFRTRIQALEEELADVKKTLERVVLLLN